MQQLIPFEQFTKQLANRNIARANSKGDNAEIVKIPLDRIVFRESKTGEPFNPRMEYNYGDIESLAAQIKAFGQLEPGRVDALTNGNFALTDGHRRVSALLLIRDEDRNDDLYFRAVLNKIGTTEKERLLQAFITQTGKPLEQYELANLFSRLINDEGMTQVELAEVTGKTPAYISQLITFSKEPAEIKEFVRMGKITVNDAIKLKSKIKDNAERIDAIKTADEKKWEQNEKRQDDFADKYEYDEDLKRTVKKEKNTTDPDDVVKKIDNTVKGKKLKMEEILSSNTIILPKEASQLSICDNGNGEWISVKDELPESLETVFISNGKGWTTLGYKNSEEGWSKMVTETSYKEIVCEEEGKIIAECERADDLDVQYWHKLPTPLII